MSYLGRKVSGSCQDGSFFLINPEEKNISKQKRNMNARKWIKQTDSDNLLREQKTVCTGAGLLQTEVEGVLGELAKIFKSALVFPLSFPFTAEMTPD